MNKKHVSFSKIPQFRDVIRNVNKQAQFVGLDKNGEPIFNNNIVKPTLDFDGTVKLHGTNSSVCTNGNEIWFQSRKRIITLENDNHGFASFCTKRIEVMKNILENIQKRINEEDYIISLFGEYCGEGIQNGVGITTLPKMFVIFAIKVSVEDKESYYVDSTNIRDTENQIYNIADFQTFNLNIDFNYPEVAQNEIVKLVEEVENECPVAKELKAKGDVKTGEGIVWTGYFKDTRHIFKTKGEKHSVTKVKKIASVDIEKVNSIKEFVNYAVTENRMKQAVEVLFTSENVEPTIQKMGDFLRWVIQDIVKEESDVLAGNDLTVKDIGRYVSNEARPWFQNLLNKNAGI